jgi:hypothetical protein
MYSSYRNWWFSAQDDVELKMKSNIRRIAAVRLEREVCVSESNERVDKIRLIREEKKSQ